MGAREGDGRRSLGCAHHDRRAREQPRVERRDRLVDRVCRHAEVVCVQDDVHARARAGPPSGRVVCVSSMLFVREVNNLAIILVSHHSDPRQVARVLESIQAHLVRVGRPTSSSRTTPTTERPPSPRRVPGVRVVRLREPRLRAARTTAHSRRAMRGMSSSSMSTPRSSTARTADLVAALDTRPSAGIGGVRQLTSGGAVTPTIRRLPERAQVTVRGARLGAALAARGHACRARPRPPAPERLDVAAGDDAHPGREPLGALRPAGLAGEPGAGRGRLRRGCHLPDRRRAGTPNARSCSTGCASCATRCRPPPAARPATRGSTARRCGTPCGWRGGSAARARCTSCRPATRPTCCSWPRCRSWPGARSSSSTTTTWCRSCSSPGSPAAGGPVLGGRAGRADHLRAAHGVISTNESYRQVALARGRKRPDACRWCAARPT